MERTKGKVKELQNFSSKSFEKETQNLNGCSMTHKNLKIWRTGEKTSGDYLHENTPQ